MDKYLNEIEKKQEIKKGLEENLNELKKEEKDLKNKLALKLNHNESYQELVKILKEELKLVSNFNTYKKHQAKKIFKRVLRKNGMIQLLICFGLLLFSKMTLSIFGIVTIFNVIFTGYNIIKTYRKAIQFRKQMYLANNELDLLKKINLEEDKIVKSTLEIKNLEENLRINSNKIINLNLEIEQLSKSIEILVKERENVLTGLYEKFKIEESLNKTYDTKQSLVRVKNNY